MLLCAEVRWCGCSRKYFFFSGSERVSMGCAREGGEGGTVVEAGDVCGGAHRGGMVGWTRLDEKVALAA